MVFFTIVSTYIALFCGLLLGRIASEELQKGAVFIKLLEKSILSIGVLLFSYIFLESLFGIIGILLSVGIAFFFWKVRFSKQIIVFFWPLALFAINDSSFFLFVTGLFALYLIVIGTKIVLPYVDKKDPYNLKISYVELIKKGIKETNLILISFLICFILTML